MLDSSSQSALLGILGDKCSDCSTVELSIDGGELKLYRERFLMCFLFNKCICESDAMGNICTNI